MRRLSKLQGIWVVAVLVAVVVLMAVLYDPVMDAIFIDGAGIGDELAP